mgnify:FL=1
MASGQKTVYVPDRSAPMYFDSGLTTEEIKSALVSTGHTAVQNSEARISADGLTIRFERVAGGTKGA